MNLKKMILPGLLLLVAMNLKAQHFFQDTNGLWGVKSARGKVLVAGKYEGLIPPVFLEGLADVRINGKHGFVDTAGKEKVPLKYDGAHFFSDGLAAVKLNGKWGFVDKTGKLIIPLKYETADNFKKGKVKVMLKERFLYIDKTGKEVKPD